MEYAILRYAYLHQSRLFEVVLLNSDGLGVAALALAFVWHLV